MDVGTHLGEVITYCEQFGFDSFGYLDAQRVVPVHSLADDYVYANVLAFRSESSLGAQLLDHLYTREE